MTGIAFKRTAQDESRIYDGAGDHVGDVYALDDRCALAPGISSCISPKTRVVLAVSTIAAASAK